MHATATRPILATTSELDPRNVIDAIQIVAGCFSSQDCKDDIANVYTNYANGIKHMASFGQEVELLRYEAVSLDQRVIGAGGIYREVGGPAHVVWLGWLGIEPSFQGRGIGSDLLKRLFAIAESFDAREIKVYTPAHLTEYTRCRAVYKHLGFQHRMEEDFTCSVEGEDVVEHMLVKSLVPPLSLDLSRHSFQPSLTQETK